MTAKVGCRHPLPADVGKFSSPSMKAVSCQAVPYLRRSVGTHWFSPCFWHRTHSASLLRAAWRAIAGSRLGLQTSSSERRPAIEGAWISSILNLLRSGLWFSAKIKQAAAEARALIGSDDYVTLHLRRGDRLTPPMCSKSMQSKSACWRFDNLTRPPAIREALAQWVSNSTTKVRAHGLQCSLLITVDCGVRGNCTGGFAEQVKVIVRFLVLQRA